MLNHLRTPSCVIVKHANPCGVASGNTLQESYQKAYASDPTSAYGGVIAFNEVVDNHLLQAIFKQQFVEIILAPSFTEKAKNIAKEKPDCRLLQYHA